MSSGKGLSKLSGSEQVEVLKGLAQPAAAWLVGMAARSLRDHADVPRTDDGRYDARELVRWASRRRGRPELDDAEYERLLIAVEVFLCSRGDDLVQAAIGERLRELADRHGEGVGLLFMDLVLDSWSAVTRSEPERDFQEGRDALRVVVRCAACGKIRQGRRWVRGKPPADHEVLGDKCAACED